MCVNNDQQRLRSRTEDLDLEIHEGGRGGGMVRQPTFGIFQILGIKQG